VKRKILSILVVLALVLGMSLVTAVPAMAQSLVQIGSTSYPTIQAAINAANSGDTINVAAGTYVEVGQIEISKNLSIVGAGAATTTIEPSANTTTSGNHIENNGAAWFVANPGVTFNLSGVTLNGSGKLIGQAICYDQGSGTVNNCTIENIKYNESGPDYEGMGIAAYNGGVDNTTPTATTNVNVTNCTFSGIGRIGIYFYAAASELAGTISGNTYTGKGTGNFLDYFVDIEGGTVTISNNTISNCLGVAIPDGSTSAGINVATYRNLGTTATITGNTVSDCSYGINVGIDSVDLSMVTANNNNLAGNTCGFANTSTTNPVDATNNWWGTAFESGIKALISGTVTYTPWLTSASSNAVTMTADGQAAVAPTVTTSAATSVAFTLATLNGNLGNMGTGGTATAGSVIVSFMYGTSSGSENVSLPSTTLTANGTFSAIIPSGLTPGTTYYFEAMAQPNDMTAPVYGAETSFTTAKITTLAATGIGAYSVTLNGHLDKGSATSVIVSFGYSLDPDTTYGTTATVTTSPMTTSGDFSARLSGLTLKGTYHFQALGTIGNDTWSGVGQTVTLVPVIGISVSPTSVNFGTITAGHSSASQPVTVTNTGDYNQSFSTTLANGSSGFYATNLEIGGKAVYNWSSGSVATSIDITPGLVLSIPKGTTAGAHTDTLIFWASSAQ